MVLLTEEKKQHIRELRRKAMKLPLHPGVYIMHDKDGTIIYIGKAKALKNRVSQYFGSEKNHDEKVRRMVSNVEYFEYILTDSEFEALILESSLIKQHQPKYNILLKDDKGYSYIKVTAGDWPRISETKQVLDDGAKYIGPYLSAWTIKDTVEEARKIFRLPSCSRKFPQDFGKGRPCLNYYIKQCSAPCRGNVSREEYQEAVQEALDFIRGGASDSVRALTAKMNEAAENMEFELAARIRDRIAAINKLKERQKVVASRVPEQDVFALVLGGEKVSVQVFRFSGGRLYDRESFILNGDSDPEQIRSEFLTQYYAIRDRIPPVVTLDGPVNDGEVIAEWLTRRAGRRVKLHVPQKGEQKQLVEMCRTNAAEALAQGQQVGQHLRGVEFVRQAVPDRHAGVLRQGFDDFLSEAAVLDAVVNAAEHARRVGDGLLLADLGTGGIEVGHAHAEVIRSDLEAAPRAGGRLFKDQRDVLAAQRVVRNAGLLLRLQLGRQVDQRADLSGRKVQQFEETASLEVHRFNLRCVSLYGHYTPFRKNMQ